MSIVTRPATADYRNNFDEVFGRRCIKCSGTLKREDVSQEEWDAAQHNACPKEGAEP